ncbi:MAG: 4'-phosphopantetheinyl transferase superfamily protein [Cyanobacteria bacterium P01_A01_bin.40]
MAKDSVWQDPLPQTRLEDDQVHIWRANLNLPDLEIDRLATYLSPDEKVRASKFRFPQHQTRFTAARGILRQLLGNYLQINPCEVKFDYSDRGKPQLSNSQQDRQLQFNLSHSQDYALYGLTYDDLIGVDVEYIRTMSDTLKIAQRFFSAREYELIKNTAVAKQQAVFFTLWTAKEAYLKAVGTGLAGSLDLVEIKLDPTSLLAIRGSKAAAASWSLYPCDPAANYVGAIAIRVEQAPTEISLYSWHQAL